MTYLYLAFFMGLFGSIHCAVMCGPLLIAINGQGSFSWTNLFNKLLYQSGRIFVYGLLGLLFGLFGNLAIVQGWQQYFSLFIGGILMLIGMFYFFGKKNTKLLSLQTRMIQPFVKVMGRWLYRPGGSFVAGMLNGILPCGMVYMALASAMNASTLEGSMSFMLLFGLGTLPLLMLFSVLAYFPRNVFRKGFNKLLPFFYLIMGLWFVLRGANLDIPYLSPLLYLDGAMNCA